MFLSSEEHHKGITHIARPLRNKDLPMAVKKP
jgi:hypothetical protein